MKLTLVLVLIGAASCSANQIRVENPLDEANKILEALTQSPELLENIKVVEEFLETNEEPLDIDVDNILKKFGGLYLFAINDKMGRTMCAHLLYLHQLCLEINLASAGKLYAQSRSENRLRNLVVGFHYRSLEYCLIERDRVSNNLEILGKLTRIFNTKWGAENKVNELIKEFNKNSKFLTRIRNVIRNNGAQSTYNKLNSPSGADFVKYNARKSILCHLYNNQLRSPYFAVDGAEGIIKYFVKDPCRYLEAIYHENRNTFYRALEMLFESQYFVGLDHSEIEKLMKPTMDCVSASKELMKVCMIKF